MKKILFTSYSGYPTQDKGGGNKIIYELLNSINFPTDYLSYDLYLKDINKINNSYYNHLSRKKKFTDRLFYKSRMFNYLVTSPFYLSYHFKKRDKYFTKIAQRNEWEIIHAHDVLCMYYFRNSKGRKILNIHSKGLLTDELQDGQKNNSYVMKNLPVFSLRETYALKVADLIIFPSKTAKNNYLERINSFSGLKDKSQVIYNGVDLEFISSVQPSEEILEGLKINYRAYEKILLNVAALVRAKNIDMILEVLKTIVHEKKKNYLYLHIGIGPEINRLVKMIDDFDLTKNVKIVPSLSNRDIIRLMKVCDIFLMTSTKVVFDLAVLEALACGITIIVSDLGGNQEIIKNNFNGFLFKREYKEELIHLIISSVKQQFYNNAVKTATNFSSKKMVENYLQIFSE